MQYAVFPKDFPKISNISSMFLSKYTISKLYRNAYVHRKEISYSVFNMEHFTSFNLIYWTSMGGLYFLLSSNLEKCGKFGKNGRFSGRIWPDWGNTTRADLAGLGSIGLTLCEIFKILDFGLSSYIKKNVLKC